MVNHTEKAKRINRIKNSFNSEEDILYWLPEIDAIYEPEVREATIRTFLKGCPNYFLTKPTSSTGKYHSPDERGKYGNLIHTKRVFKEYCDMSESYVGGGEMTDYQRECGKAATLIHDMMKYGWPSDGNEHTVNDHDIIAAEVAQHIGDCPSEVVLLVHAHMGPWGEGMLPENDRQWLLHFADKSASSTDEDRIAIYYPADELLDEWPDLPVIAEENIEEPI